MTTKHMVKIQAATKIFKVLGRNAKKDGLHQASDAYYFAAEVVKYIGIDNAAEDVLKAAAKARASSAWWNTIEECVALLPKMRELA